MWQTAVVLLIVAAVLLYIIRHYARVFRAEAPACSSCAGCCASKPDAGQGPCDCHGDAFSEAHGSGGRTES